MTLSESDRLLDLIAAGGSERNAPVGYCFTCLFELIPNTCAPVDLLEAH